MHIADVLGPLYYLYLLLLPTFTTNSINILAGVNGVECIQALIIALSVLVNDLLFLPLWPKALLEILGTGDPKTGRFLSFAGGEMVQRHLMSAYFMGPLVGVCAGFLWHNWYVPSDLASCLKWSPGITPPDSQGVLFELLLTMVQVSRQSLSWRHILLLLRNGLLGRRSPRTFQQNTHTVLRPADLQLHLIVSSAIPLGRLSATQAAGVSIAS